MYAKIALIGGLLVASAAPAMAAEFYIVHDKSAKKCTIVEEKPTMDTVVVVGDKAYTTRAEAEDAVKTVKVCEQ